MRPILILSLVFALAGGVLASTGMAPVRLTVQDEAEAPFAQPVLKLLALPEGAVDAAVAFAPESPESGLQIRTLPPMIMRGMRVVPVVIGPGDGQRSVEQRPDEQRPDGQRPDGPSPGGRLSSASGSVEIDVVYHSERVQSAETASLSGYATPTLFPAPFASSAKNGSVNALRRSRGYFDTFDLIRAPGARPSASSSEEGSYLIITAPEFASQVEPLAAWKREKGHVVSVVTTTETGVTKEEIRTYIGEQYHNAEIPPEYVILVGDIDQIPTFGISGNVTDLPYTLQDGDDFLPDLHVGRLSAQNPEKAELIVAKILRHEKDPFREDGGAWMTRGIAVATNSNATTPVSVSSWCRRRMLEAGFSTVDSAFVFQGQHHGQVLPLYNAGASLVTYRGWAAAERGWAGQFTTDQQVPQITNTWKLPVVFSFVCANNKFDTNECFGEALLRSGTLANPKGAVGFIGNSEHWSHTRFNDAAAIGAFTGIHSGGARKLGDILNSIKLYILSQYPLEIPFSTDAGESVEFYFYIYGLQGDPDMELRIGTQKEISVTHPSAVSLGSNLLQVAVTEAGGPVPVAGARVGVIQGDALLGCAWTDESGNASVPMSPVQGSTPIRITVTGTDLIPYQGEAEARNDLGYVALDALVIEDNGSGQSIGNGDAVPNPGETLQLRVTLKNQGAASVGAGQAILTSLGVGSVVTGTVDFSALPPGGSAQTINPFVVSIPALAEDGAEAVFRLSAVTGGTTSESDIRLTVTGPALRLEEFHLAAGEFVPPGEESDLSVMVRNEGSIAASGVTAVLRSMNTELMTVVDSTAAYGDLSVGASASNPTPLRVRASGTAAPGQAAAFKLILTSAAGAVSETPFSLPLGEVNSTAPLGPDAHGYWAYDNADTDYPDTAPLYEWIECSPAYGGSGTRISLQDNRTTVVNLPFPFVFYGQTYNRVRISDNGWIALDTSVDLLDFYNWSLPSPYGCGARICPFWDNLDPAKAVNNVPVGDGIYTFNDAENHRFVVEWSRLGNTDQSGVDSPLIFKDLQTFQVILYDPAVWPSTGSDDGIIQFQYKQILNIDSGRTWATVGIENEAKDDALQCTYSNVYAPTAAPLSAGQAIRFTTAAPRFSPFDLARFAAAPDGGGVLLAWDPIDQRPRKGYRVYRAEAGDRSGSGEESGADYRLVTTVSLDGSARSFVDTGADPSKAYRYKIGSMDPVGRETLVGPYVYDPSASENGPAQTLGLNLRNPFQGTGAVTYSVPQRGPAALRVYDVTGRAVRTLLDGTIDSGSGAAAWDGRDDDGRELPGGIYFARLESGGRQKTEKLVLIRGR